MLPIRHDSAAKQVAGRAIYTDDIAIGGAPLHLALALSPIARGRLTSLDLSAVRGAAGVELVLTADDIPGENNAGPVAHDEPILALSARSGAGDVLYAGQALFAVAARTREQARAAAQLAEFECAEETPILTIDDAMAQNSFIEAAQRFARGDARAAIDAAPRRLDGRIEIGGQDHFYLEGQVALAIPGEDDEMHLTVSTQHPTETQHITAAALGCPAHAVTVEVRRMGGGFGGKETQANLPAMVAAITARLTRRPAKINLDRDDDMIMTGKRHPFRVDYEVGFDDYGLIRGIRFEQFANCGWSQDLSPAIADRAMFHADNAYSLPDIEIVSHRCRTNIVSMTAFRGFGGPQGIVGIERVMDEIAATLGLDPLDVRRRNFYPGPEAPPAARTTPYGMVVEDCVIGEIVDDLVESSGYHARREAIRRENETSRLLKRGIALTPVKFGISFTTTHLNQAGALVHIYQDGSVMLNHGGTEMGQGLFTKVAQVAALELGVPLERVKITATRTDKVPNTSATAASSGSDLNGMAVRDACRKLMARLDAFRRERFGEEAVAWDTLIKAAYMARISLSATGFYATPGIEWDRKTGKGKPFYYFAYGAAVTEAVVDVLTGENRLVRVDILHDVGRSLNPALDLGQIEGGYIQGAGWLTMEELWWNDRGALKTHAPSTYKIPCASDRPEMDIRIWPRGENRALTIRRSKAVGEPPFMLGISAFLALSDAAAAADAHRTYPALDAPATPERLLMAIEALKGTR